MAAAVIMRQQDAIDERQIRLGVEVLLLVSPNKIAGGNADRPQDLLGVSFSPRGNLRLLTAPRPSAVKGRRLPKRCFVLINDHRAFIPGFFFKLGEISEFLHAASESELGTIPMRNTTKTACPPLRGE